MFSPFRSLRSLSKPGMYLFFSFWQIAVTFGSGSVSFFLLLADCSHFRIPECIFFSPFRSLRSLSEPGMHLFSPFHYLRSLSEPGMYLFFSFSLFAVTFGSRSVSFFLFFQVCSHFGNPEVYLIFSFSQSAVTLVPGNSAGKLAK